MSNYPIIVQFKYTPNPFDSSTCWKHWKDLGTFESYEHALQVLQIKIERWKKDGECIEIYSSLYPYSIEEKLEIKLELHLKIGNEFHGDPYFCEFRFYDTTSQKVITRESLWTIGLNNEMLNEKPCNPDHNGECLICDCWLSNCALDRLKKGDFKYETLDELLNIFKDYLTEEEVRNLRTKFDKK